MTEHTPLDLAHAAMVDAPDDDAARLRFYERLADAELFLMLAKPAEGEAIEPEVFALGNATYVLVFDREDRLTRFAERAVPYVALSGRVIAGMLYGQGIGLGVNLDVAPSAILIPDDAVSWLAETLDDDPQTEESRIGTVHAPDGVPETLLTSLDTKLASAAGLAQRAYLVKVIYVHGGTGHMLAIVGAPKAAEPALASAMSESLKFSGLEAGQLDVVFLDASDMALRAIAEVGLRFDVPQPHMPQDRQTPGAPGMDPNAPPILK